MHLLIINCKFLNAVLSNRMCSFVSSCGLLNRAPPFGPLIDAMTAFNFNLLFPWLFLLRFFPWLILCIFQLPMSALLKKCFYCRSDLSETNGGM